MMETGLAGLAGLARIGDDSRAYRRSRTPALSATIATYTCVHTGVPKLSPELSLAKYRRLIMPRGKQRRILPTGNVGWKVNKWRERKGANFLR